MRFYCNNYSLLIACPVITIPSSEPDLMPNNDRVWLYNNYDLDNNELHYSALCGLIEVTSIPSLYRVFRTGC